MVMKLNGQLKQERVLLGPLFNIPLFVFIISNVLCNHPFGTVATGAIKFTKWNTFLSELKLRALLLLINVLNIRWAIVFIKQTVSKFTMQTCKSAFLGFRTKNEKTAPLWKTHGVCLSVLCSIITFDPLDLEIGITIKCGSIVLTNYSY